MSIMDLFRPAPQQTAQPQPQPNNPQNPQVTSGNNPTVPSATTTAPSPNSPVGITTPATGNESPLDKFQDLWKLPESKSGENTAPNLRPSFQVDPAKMMQAAQGLDFTKMIAPELLAKAQSGDQSALMQIINGVGQAGYAQAAMAATKITEQALSRQADAIEAMLPDMMRKYGVSSAIRTDNPIFNNPAVAPVLQTVEQQLAQKYPHETPSQISARAKDYLNAMAGEIVKSSGGSVATSQNNSSGGTAGSKGDFDWDKWVTG